VAVASLQGSGGCHGGGLAHQGQGSTADDASAEDGGGQGGAGSGGSSRHASEASTCTREPVRGKAEKIERGTTSSTEVSGQSGESGNGRRRELKGVNRERYPGPGALTLGIGAPPRCSCGSTGKRRRGPPSRWRPAGEARRRGPAKRGTTATEAEWGARSRGLVEELGSGERPERKCSLPLKGQSRME